MCQGGNHQRNKMLDTEPTIPVPTPSKVAKTIDTEHSYSTSEVSTSEKVIKLNKKVKNIESKGMITKQKGLKT